jgi:hypothetical protein
MFGRLSLKKCYSYFMGRSLVVVGCSYTACYKKLKPVPKELISSNPGNCTSFEERKRVRDRHY